MGGNAFPEAGTIHIDEIKPTLLALSSAINIDVTNNILGSVGKREYSGDIDIALDIPKDQQHALFNKLKKIYGENGNVRKMGVVSVLVPIEQYDASNNERQPRTGLVQVDFMYGNILWNKFYFHSPAETESNFKGTHRNIALTSICRHLDAIESVEVDEYNRPMEITRWKWSSTTGLCRVKRTSRINKQTGKCIKKQDEIFLDQQFKDPSDITCTLFGPGVDPSALDSLESIITLINNPNHFNQAIVPKVFETMARNFTQHHVLKLGNYIYPSDIAQYLKSDK